MSLRCPDRETSVPELAFNGSFLAATAVYTAAACCIFVANRTKFPIAQRSPVLVLVCAIGLICLVVIMDVSTMIPRKFNCIGTYLALLPLLAAVILGYLIRFVYICLEYEIARRLAEKLEVGETSPLLQKLLSFRVFLNSPIKFSVTFILIVFVTSILPLILVAAKMDSNDLLSEDSCSKMKLAFAYLFVFYLIFFIAASLILSYFLRRVQENFFIMAELKLLILVALYLLVANIIGTFVDSIARASNCKFRFLMIICHMIPMILGATVSLVYPLYKMKYKAPSSTEISSSGRSSVFKSRQQDLLNILRDPVKSEHFKQFLVKEFASENFLFWARVENLQKLSENREALIAEIKKIYEEFCENDSVCCINISFGVREALCDRMKNLDQMGSEDLVTVFQECKKEIEILMLRDSFARFCLSKEFKAMSSQLETVTPRTLIMTTSS